VIGGRGGRWPERLHRDQRGLISGWLIRTIVIMAILGLAIEEGGQVIGAQVRAESAARAAAQAAADSYRFRHDVARARQAADTAAREADDPARIVGFAIDTNGAATVTVLDVAHTIVIRRVSFLEHFGDQRATDTETPSS
jgi:hypothetical protein